MAFGWMIMKKEFRVCLCCAASTHSSQRFGFNIPDLSPISRQSLLYMFGNLLLGSSDAFFSSYASAVPNCCANQSATSCIAGTLLLLEPRKPAATLYTFEAHRLARPRVSITRQAILWPAKSIQIIPYGIS